MPFPDETDQSTGKVKKKKKDPRTKYKIWPTAIGLAPLPFMGRCEPKGRGACRNESKKKAREGIAI